VTAGARVQHAARLLGNLRGEALRPAALPKELAPRSEAEAYEIQTAVARSLGAQVGGWKASMSGPDRGQAAPVYRAAIYDSPARVPCPGPDGVGIEPEIAFTLGRDMEPLSAGRRYGLAQLEAAIDAVHPVIEIVHSRFAVLAAAPPLDRLADNLSNAGLVRGAACRDWRALALGALPLRLEVLRADGSQSVHEGPGGHGQGDPRVPLLWLVNDAIARGAPLCRGDLVTTGSCAGLHAVQRGTRILVDFAGVGTVRLELI
jgi:2-keto-4-pentenoate hydratase